MPRNLNTPFHLFSDRNAWFQNMIYCSLYCGLRKSVLGNFGHNQSQADGGLFQLYPISLPWHRCKTCRKPTRHYLLVLNMTYGNCLNHILCRSLLKPDYSLLHPLMGTFIRKFICENARADNIIMFCFTDCADKSLCWPWWFPFRGSD